MSPTPFVSPGQVISALRETGLLNNTVVIFTADHGELAMEHRQFYKMSMFEGSSHVPLMIMGPGLMSGLQVNQLVSLVDLYPTLLGKKLDRKHKITMFFKDYKSLKCLLKGRIRKVCPMSVTKQNKSTSIFIFIFLVSHTSVFCRHCWYSSSRYSQWQLAPSSAVQGRRFLQAATSRLGSE